MKATGRFIALVVVAAALAACSTTELVGQWADPQYRGEPVDNVLVVARVADDTLRRVFEDQLVAVLQERGIEAGASYRLLPEAVTMTDAPLQSRIRDLGLEGVLVTQLIDQERIAVGVPYYWSGGPYRPYGTAFGSPFYDPYRGWPYGDWHGYYGVAPPYSEPTYATAYLIESRLHRGDGVVWSAQTRTTTQEPLESKVDEVVQEVVEQMAEEGMI